MKSSATYKQSENVTPYAIVVSKYCENDSNITMSHNFFYYNDIIVCKFVV